MTTTPRFLDRGRRRTFAEGEALWGGDAGRPFVAYVVEGTVDFGPAAAETNPCGPDSLLGIVDTCVGSEPPLFTARALTAVECYGWTRDEFMLALGLYQELAVAAIQTLSSRLRAVNLHARQRESRHG